MKNKKLAVKILREAKGYLTKNHKVYNSDHCTSKFICVSMDLACDGEPTRSERYQTKTQLKKLIESRIAPYINLESWLENKKLTSGKFNVDQFNQIQAYRHRWLDSLIKELS